MCLLFQIPLALDAYPTCPPGKGLVNGNYIQIMVYLKGKNGMTVMTLEGAVPKHQSNARFLLLTLLTLILVLTKT